MVAELRRHDDTQRKEADMVNQSPPTRGAWIAAFVAILLSLAAHAQARQNKAPPAAAPTAPPTAAPAAAPTATPTATLLKPETLEALLAPIALYPDSLLTQMLMASTYPLEIVKADRWAK